MRIVPAIALMLLAGACQSVPVQELRGYAAAYEQVRAAGDLVLDEISPIVTAANQDSGQPSGVDRSAAADCSRSDSSGFPPCFDPDLALGEAGLRRGEDASIAFRRNALAAVAEYNTIMLALADGESTLEIERRIDRLGGFVSTAASLGVVPSAGLSLVAPAAVELIKGLAGRFAQARANADIRRSIVASKGDIQQLLELLGEDTASIYEVYVRGQEAELVRLNGAKNRARLEGNDELRDDFEAQLEMTKRKVNDFHASLGAYTRLLAAARMSLDNLVVAVEADEVSIENAISVIRDAAEIQAKAEAFFALIRAVKTPTQGAPAS